MRIMLKPIGAFFMSLLMQLLGVVIFIAAAFVVTGNINIRDNQTTAISLSLVIASLLSIVAMIWPMNMFNVKRDLKPSGIELKYALMAIVATIIGIVGIDVLSSLADMPNLVEQQFNNMSMNVAGALAISIIGPIAEEVVFRGAILGYLLRNGMNFKKAIFISALMFGIMHINPAQVPFAFVVGLMLGVVYYKTGNILLTSIIHILNNSFATVMTFLSVDYEDATVTTLTEYLGATGVVLAIIISIVALAVCSWMLYTLCKRLPDIEYQEKHEESEEPVVTADGISAD